MSRINPVVRVLDAIDETVRRSPERVVIASAVTVAVVFVACVVFPVPIWIGLPLLAAACVACYMAVRFSISGGRRG